MGGAGDGSFQNGLGRMPQPVTFNPTPPTGAMLVMVTDPGLSRQANMLPIVTVSP